MNNLIDRKTSDFLYFLRLVMVMGLVFLHLFAVPGDINYPRSGMQDYTYFWPSVINSLWHMAFMTSVPLLSAISGYLFAHKYPGFSINAVPEIYLKKARSLLLPMVIWCLLWLGVGWLVYTFEPNGVQRLSGGYDLGNFGLLDLLNAVLGLQRFPYAIQFWFIHDLLVTFIFAPFIFLVIRSKTMALVATAGAFAIWFSGFVPPGLFTTNVAFFFFLGAMLRYFEMPVLGDWLNRWWPVFLLISLVFAVILVLRAWTYLFLPEDAFVTRLVRSEHFLKLLRCFGSISFFWALYQFSRFLPKIYHKAVALSGISFFLFASHLPLLGLFKIALADNPLVSSEGMVFALLFLLPTITIAIGLGTGVILRRYCPGTFRLLNGGR